MRICVSLFLNIGGYIFAGATSGKGKCLQYETAGIMRYFC